jgi:hypothetical protein
MDLKKLFASTTLSLAAVPAFADTYQSEIHLNLTKTNETLFDNDKKGGLLSGTIFFKPVELNDHPFAEAAFLEKSSNFNFSFGYEKGESGGSFLGAYWPQDSRGAPYTGNYDTKRTNSFAEAKVEYYIPNTMLYVGGAIDKLDARTRTLENINSPTTMFGVLNRYEYSDSSTIWTASLGITPLDGLLVWSDYSKSQNDSNSWSLNSKYLVNFKDHDINLEAGYTHTSDSEKVYRVAADYYIDRSFSVGAVYYSSPEGIWGDVGRKYVNDHMTDLDAGPSDKTYGLRAKKFFANDLALDASFTKSDSDFTNSDTGDKFSIGITKRF